MKKSIFFLLYILLPFFSLQIYGQTKLRGAIFMSMGSSYISGLDNAVKRHGYLPESDFYFKNFSSGHKFLYELGAFYQLETYNNNFYQINFAFGESGTTLSGVTDYSESNIKSINKGVLIFNTFVGKKFDLNRDTKFLIGAGPCLVINIWYGYGGSYMDPKLKPLEIGVNGMLGLEYKNLQLSIIKDYSFSRTFNDRNFNTHYKSFKISIAYFIPDFIQI